MQEGEGRGAAGGLGLASSWALSPEAVYPEVAAGCGVTANREDTLETQILPGPTAAVFPLRCQPLPLCICLLFTEEVSKDSTLPYFHAEDLFWWLLLPISLPLGQGYPQCTSPVACLYRRPFGNKIQHLAPVVDGVNPSCLL